MTVHQLTLVFNLVSEEREKLLRKKKRMAPNNIIELSIVDKAVTDYGDIITELSNQFAAQTKKSTK